MTQFWLPADLTNDLPVKTILENRRSLVFEVAMDAQRARAAFWQVNFL